MEIRGKQKDTRGEEGGSVCVKVSDVKFQC